MTRWWTQYRLRKKGLAGKPLRKKHAKGWFQTLLEGSHVVKTLIAVTGCLGTVAIMLLGQISYRDTVELYVGQPATADVFADIGFSYENREETQKLKIEASQRVPPHYSVNVDRARSCAHQISGALGIGAGEGGEAKPASPPPRGNGHARNSILMPAELDPLKKTSAPARLAQQMESFLVEVSGTGAPALLDAEQAMAKGLGGQDGERHRRALLVVLNDEIERRASAAAPRDRLLRDAVVTALLLSCERSIEYDEKLTQFVRDRAAAQVKPVITRVHPGSKIIEKGYEVTPRQVEVYSAYLARREQAEPLAARMRERWYYILGLT
ncbi:MAG: hypothetical protein NT045_07265, partial [Candidatus Aureabacteria bacterium]|nr:hypothetical protein [Candidatus Auribacterota bacterium]